MKTLKELYTEIIGSDELKKAYLEAAKGGKIAEFLKVHGCEATAEEIKAFLKERSNQQLSDDELDSVAGGGCNGETGTDIFVSIASIGLGCAAVAIMSAQYGHVGQKNEDEGRLCNLNE